MPECYLRISFALWFDCCSCYSLFLGLMYPNFHVGALPYPLVPEYDLVDRDTRSASRDASMCDNWLLNPDRYTILATCGSHEKAKGGFEVAHAIGRRFRVT